MRGDRNLSKFESLEAFANGHLNALKRFGKDPASLVEVPSKPDDEKAWGELWGKLGRPEKADGYQLTLSENATPEDKAFAEGFREVAHKHGLTQAQMGAAIGYLNEVTAKATSDAEAAEKAAGDKVTSTLKAEWGDKYPVYSKDIMSMVDEFGGEGAYEALNADGLGNSLTMFKILAKVSDLRAEPGRLPGGGGGGGDTTALTPYQATAKIAELHGDPVKYKALTDKTDPLHRTVKEERDRLLKIAYPAQ